MGNERQPRPLDEPCSVVERNHIAMMNEELWRYDTEKLVTIYNDARILYEYWLSGSDYMTDEEARMSKDITDIIYCELVERGMEFIYQSLNKKKADRS